MVQYGYSIKDMNDTRAHACLRDAPISYKTATMIAQRLKGLSATKALIILKGVEEQRIAIPYTKFNDSMGHRPGGIGPGRYPEKAAKLFTTLINNAVANAEDKNLGKDVTIEFVVAQRASLPWHQGNKGRRKFKRSHVELVVTNAPINAKDLAKKKAKAAKKTTSSSEKNETPKKSNSKTESKKVVEAKN